MALKALLNGQPAYAWDVAGTGDFACAECGDGMYYRRAQRRADGVTVVAHFAHRPLLAGRQRTCSISHESEEHENAKETIRLTAPGYFWWLKGASGDVETRLEEGDIKRRADVLFVLHDRQRVVFEVQFTKISRREIARRTTDYHRMQCHVIWCFPEKRDDLYMFCWKHFYCVGRLSNDGTQIDFRGNISPFHYRVPSLKRPFDAEYMPIVTRPAPLPPIEYPRQPVFTLSRSDVQTRAPIDWRQTQEMPQTPYHTLIRPRETPETSAQEMLQRHQLRRAANTLPDGSRPYAWWMRYRKDYRDMATMTDADIQRDAARAAKVMDEMIEESHESEKEKYGTVIGQRRAS